jgi:hypothetical protein
MNIKNIFKNKCIIIILLLLSISIFVFTYNIKETFEVHFSSERCYDITDETKCNKNLYPGCLWLPNNKLDDGKGNIQNINNFILSSDATERDKILKKKCKAYQDFKCSLFDNFRENCIRSSGCYFSFDNKCKNSKDIPCDSLGEKQNCNDNPKCTWYTTGWAVLGNQISKCLKTDICDVKYQDQCESAGPHCYWTGSKCAAAKKN